MNSQRQRGRSVCYTLNNPTDEELVHLKSLITKYPSVFKYHVHQLERGSQNGTLHVQGYIQASNPVEFKTWKRYIGDRAYLAFTKGTPEQNRAYCTKDADRVPGSLIYEEGEIPSPGKRNDILAFTERIQVEGSTIGELALEFPLEFLKYPNAFAQTGLGKSYSIRQLAPNGYWKSCNNHWWNGYDPLGHTDVVLDDYRTNWCDFSQLLRYFDEYPLSVEFKGGVSVFRPRRIFVSCPKPPVECWNLRSEEDLQQLVRRIEVIVEICPGHIRRYVKGSEADLAPTQDSGNHERSGGAPDEANVAPAPGQDTHQRFELTSRAPTFNLADEPPLRRSRFIVEDDEEVEDPDLSRLTAAPGDIDVDFSAFDKFFDF